jgi:hypothetical protein
MRTTAVGLAAFISVIAAYLSVAVVDWVYLFRT